MENGEFGLNNKEQFIEYLLSKGELLSKENT